jgi:hypothetical protein
LKLSKNNFFGGKCTQYENPCSSFEEVLKTIKEEFTKIIVLSDKVEEELRENVVIKDQKVLIIPEKQNLIFKIRKQINIQISNSDVTFSNIDFQFQIDYQESNPFISSKYSTNNFINNKIINFNSESEQSCFFNGNEGKNFNLTNSYIIQSSGNIFISERFNFVNIQNTNFINSESSQELIIKSNFIQIQNCSFNNSYVVNNFYSNNLIYNENYFYNSKIELNLHGNINFLNNEIIKNTFFIINNKIDKYFFLRNNIIKENNNFEMNIIDNGVGKTFSSFNDTIINNQVII